MTAVVRYALEPLPKNHLHYMHVTPPEWKSDFLEKDLKHIGHGLIERASTQPSVKHEDDDDGRRSCD